jgi:hypothetical protein
MRNAAILSVPYFTDESDAWDWMYEEVDDPCIDNTRLAVIGDKDQEAAYEAQERDGCCGFFDRKVNIAGRLHWIGCNYGH